MTVAAPTTTRQLLDHVKNHPNLFIILFLIQIYMGGITLFTGTRSRHCAASADTSFSWKSHYRIVPYIACRIIDMGERIAGKRDGPILIIEGVPQIGKY